MENSVTGRRASMHACMITNLVAIWPKSCRFLASGDPPEFEKRLLARGGHA